jgi:hypothetical protein
VAPRWPAAAASSYLQRTPAGRGAAKQDCRRAEPLRESRKGKEIDVISLLLLLSLALHDNMTTNLQFVGS